MRALLLLAGAVSALGNAVAEPSVDELIATPPGDFEYCLAPDSRSGSF